MIKTLKASNGSNAKTGNVQVQPVTDDVGYNVKQQVNDQRSNSSKGSTSASESTLNVSALSVDSTGLSTATNISLSTIAKSLISDSKFLMPAMDSKTNQILPSSVSKVLSKTSNDDFVVPAKKRTFVEDELGISEQRPEIVMMTNFLPLFDKTVKGTSRTFSRELDDNGSYPYMTDAGRFVDTHLMARNLRHADAVHVVRNIRNNYAKASEQLEKQKQKLEDGITDLEQQAEFLLGLVRNLHRLKGQLDMRDSIHTVETERIAASFSNRSSSRRTATPLSDISRNYVPPTYTVSDALERLGYNENNIKLYSSTKVWLQLLHELKNVLMFHSLDFIDSPVTTQKNDKGSSRITRSRSRHFSLKNQDLPTASSLGATEPTQVTQAVNVLSQAWDKLYVDVNFKSDESRIAALAALVSKEFRYSYSLGQQTNRKFLAERFAYDVNSNDNVRLFDAVIGEIGDDIADVQSASDTSLASLAQRRPTRGETVLTFESKNIDDGDDTLIPGSAYYVDSVLETDGSNFSTDRLETLAKSFSRAHDSFISLTSNMNLLGTFRAQEQGSFAGTLSDPDVFMSFLLEQIINVNNGETLAFLRNDSLSAVYSLAASNNKLKTQLFLYTLTRLLSPSKSFALVPFDPFDSLSTFAPIDNSPTTNALVDKILATLMSSVKQSNASGVNPFSSNYSKTDIKKDTIKSCLKHGTQLTRFIESTVAKVYSMFKASGLTTLDDQRYNAGGGAIVNDRTRYGDYVDTSMMMVVYDLILSLVVKYSNQSIVSVNSGASQLGITSFAINKTNTNHKASADDIIVRLRKESGLTQKLVFCVLNTLENLSESFTGYVSFLKTPRIIAHLQRISTLIGDPSLVKFALGEQQIMVLASAVKDLRDRLNQRRSVPANGDVDGDGSFDADDVMKLLDDSVVLPKLRDALYGLMGTSEFASKKGYNKKILTVGLPLGFTENLKQRININKLKKTSFIDKQADIVSIAVYKVDLQNGDIVYKPQRFLFEVSRFPVRNDEHFIDIPEEPTLAAVIRSIPTRDFANNSSGNAPTYWSITSDDLPRNMQPAFSSETYSFLSDKEKNELAKNHVISYLSEVYTKLLTGISVADYHFDLVDAPRYMNDSTRKLVVDHHISSIASAAKTPNMASSISVAGGVLFASTANKRSAYVSKELQSGKSQKDKSNSTGTAGNVSARQTGYAQTTLLTKSLAQQSDVGTLDDNLSLISQRRTPAALHGLRTASNLSHSLTTLSDPEAIAKRFVSPKQFDRVFNLIIDPDDFEIDYDKTVKTPHGKQSLELLISNGDVVPASENDRTLASMKRGATVSIGSRGFVQSRASYNFASYKFRDRDKNQGDLAFEKYFVTVETYGEEQD